MGGMLVGGHFLAEFVPDGLPWAHIDIAGPSYNTGAPWGYTPKGGTGVPVRTLLATIEALIADVTHAGAGPAARSPRGATEPALREEARGPYSGVVLLAGAPVAHPLGVAGDLGVVDRDREVAGQLAGDVGAVDAPPGPLAVGGDQHDRRLGDRRPRLDVPLDAAAAGDELLEVGQVGALRAAVEGAPAPVVAPARRRPPPRSRSNSPISRSFRSPAPDHRPVIIAAGIGNGAPGRVVPGVAG